MSKAKKKRITKKQRLENAYAFYRLAWDLYDYLASGDMRAIEALMGIVEGGNTLTECRATAIGLYHKFLGEEEQITLQEFSNFYDSLDSSAGGIFIMDGGDARRSDYEIYLTTYLIDRLDNSSVFSKISSSKELGAIYDLALEDSRDPDRSRPRSSNGTELNHGMSSLLAPIAASLGVALFTQFVNKSKSEVAVCQSH